MTRFFPVLAAGLALAACNALENLIKIPVTVNSEVTIPAGTGIGVLTSVTAQESSTNMEEELELNDTRLDRLKTVELRECDLTLISPSNSDFGFLNDIEVYIADEELGDVLIASKSNIPDNVGKSLTLQVEDGDLTAYLSRETITLRTKVVTDEILLTGHEVKIRTKFRVTADLF